jgi:glycosyltransferase involved in cell wall biosynthesis
MQIIDFQLKKPTVSIIIPTFNRNETLKRAVKSALDQTFEAIEIIVIDDASDISPEKMVASFNDSRIKFIRHNLNRGGAAARNTGINASIGNYIAFLDSDDEWLPEKLSSQIRCLENRSIHFGAHYSGLTIISSKNEIVGIRSPSAAGDISTQLYASNCIGPLSSVVVRRNALDQCGLFDEDLPSCQDWDLYIRLSQHFKFECTEKALVNYYLGKNSITSNPMAKAIGHRRIVEKYMAHIKRDRNALYKQLITIGHYFCKASHTKKGRREFIRAIRAIPFKLQGYIYIVFSLLGGKAYNRLVKIRHQI